MDILTSRWSAGIYRNYWKKLLKKIRIEFLNGFLNEVFRMVDINISFPKQQMKEKKEIETNNSINYMMHNQVK